MGAPGATGCNTLHTAVIACTMKHHGRWLPDTAPVPSRKQENVVQIVQPPEWKRPKGYANGVIASGRMLFVAGQVGWDADEVFRSDDLVGQIRQALANVLAILAAADAGPRHIVRMTWYLGDAAEYNARLGEIGAVYRELVGHHYPAMSAVQVAGFVEAGAKVEIEVTAVLPDD